MDAVVFYVAGILAVASSILVVTCRNPVYSAIFLVFFFTMVSVEFLTLRAPFLAVIQVLVYAGALMVLFLFVIMLLDLTAGELVENVSPWRKAFSGLGAALLFALLATAIAGSDRVRNAPSLTGDVEATLDGAGSTAAVARSLTTEHVLPFEFASILILIAIIGAIYLTRTARRNDRNHRTQSAGEEPA